MSLIKNLVREPENKTFKIGIKNEVETETQTENKNNERKFVRTATDIQRLKLEKLMKNPDKPIIIPEPRQTKDYMENVPSFVRNVMGSSAGAGSGEFHVYRHLRRKEYARQKLIQTQSLNEKLDEQFQQKLENNLRIAEEKTAKKELKG